MTRDFRLTRRSALMLPISGALTATLGGCSMFDDWFADTKSTLPGKREALQTGLGDRLAADAGLSGRLDLPTPRANADWPQSGGDPAHAMGQVAAGRLDQIWRASIGDGGGYRDKITAEPVVANGRVFTMDSNGLVSAFNAATGEQIWNCGTRPEKNRSSNVGGGLAFDGGRIYASTGRAELLAIDAANGHIIWRKPLGDAARSAPSVENGRAFVITVDGRLLAFKTGDGDQIWSYQAQSVTTSLLGQPAPALSGGMLVAGFGSGDLVAMRADTGVVAWSDNLGSPSGRDSLIDLSSIRGLPVIANDRVYVAGLGGLMVALDLRSGRRLWEHEVASGDTPWLAGNWLFAISTGQVLAAISALDGKVRWAANLPRYKNPKKSKDPIFWRGPVLAGGMLLATGSDKSLLAADPQTGKILKTVELPDAASLAPVVAGGIVYVVTEDGSLTAFR